MNYKLLLFLFLHCLIFTSTKAQTQHTNLQSSGGELSSYPTEFYEHKGKLYFAAVSNYYGDELWVSDGTEANTRLLVDLNPGMGSSSPKNLLTLNDELFFIATDGTDGQQLFKFNDSNGKVQKMTSFTDKLIRNLTLVNDRIFFIINENKYLQLWMTDGTKAGTTFIETNIQSTSSTTTTNDIQTYSSLASFEGSDNGLFFFETNESSNGSRIWRSDGTVAGTIPLTARLSGNGAGSDEAGSGGTAYLTQHIFFKGHLYFVTRTGIMKTNGTAGNTVTVKQLNYGNYLIDYADVVEVNGKLYFSFFDLDNNWHFIWESDGTETGTRLVYNVSSSQYFIPSNLLPVNGNILFTSKSSNENSTSLYSFDPRNYTLTTVMKLDESAQRPPFFYFGRVANNLYNLNGRVLAGITKPTNTVDKSSYFINLEDGTKVSGPDIVYNATFHPFKNQYYFPAINDKLGSELWTTDGTPSNTQLFKNINTGKSGLSFSGMHLIGDKIIFDALDISNENGRELWSFDTNTKKASVFADINKGAASSNPSFYLKFKDKLYFAANHAETGRELWVTDGTAAGTSIVADFVEGAGSTSPSMLTNVGNKTLFFKSSINFREQLMKTDGTTIVSLRSMGVNNQDSPYWITSMVASGDKVFFSVSGEGDDLWVSDGTEAGTVKVLDLNNIKNMTYSNGLVYFTANQANTYSTPVTLWKSDGTAAGTTPVFEYEQLPLTQIRHLIAYNNALYFVAYHKEYGHEIWKTDGTTAGTVMLKDIAPGTLSAVTNPSFTVFGNELYFAATDRENGMEIWRTDGTAESTILLHDIAKGSFGSSPQNFTPIEDKLYFSAITPDKGAELWVTDGTTATLVSDILPGTNHSAPSNMIQVNKTLYFVASTEQNGRQLWSLSTETVTGVADNALSNSLTLYPNPATDFISFRYDRGKSQKIKEIAVVDMLGRKQQVRVHAEEETVYIGTLSSGIYLMIFQIGEDRVAKRFIKQ